MENISVIIHLDKCYYRKFYTDLQIEPNGLIKGLSKEGIGTDNDCWYDFCIDSDLIVSIETLQQYIPANVDGVFYLWEKKEIWKKEPELKDNLSIVEKAIQNNLSESTKLTIKIEKHSSNYFGVDISSPPKYFQMSGCTKKDLLKNLEKLLDYLGIKKK